MGFQHHAKIQKKLMIQFQGNAQIGGQREGWKEEQTLFYYRTLPTTVRVYLFSIPHHFHQSYTKKKNFYFCFCFRGRKMHFCPFNVYSQSYNKAIFCFSSFARQPKSPCKLNTKLDTFSKLSNTKRCCNALRYYFVSSF